MAGDLADVDARILEIRRAFEKNSRRLGQVRQQIKKSEQAWRNQADVHAAHSRNEIARILTNTETQIDRNADDARSQSIGITTRLIEQSAPGYLSGEWNDRAWSDLVAPAPGQWLRVGSIERQETRLPIVLPLSSGVWSVRGGDADNFRALVQNTLLRLIAAFDVNRIRVIAYDPHLTLDLGAFATIRSVQMKSVPPPLTSVDDLERELGTLVTDLAVVHDRLTASGIDSYWKALSQEHAIAAATPLRVLIVAASADQLSERGKARLAQARRLAADHGLLVLEIAAPGAGTTGSGISISLTAESATSNAIPNLSWMPDPWVGDQRIRDFCARLVDRPRASLTPKVDFRKIIESIKDPWMADTDEGLEVPIGTTDGGNLVIRLRSDNPAMPNALVGGSVGSGKSNLLLVIIHALAVRYSPAELEMVLIDLRDGVEFGSLAPNRTDGTWLPHVRALGLEFDADYSIAVLKWVSDQMSVRADLLKKASSAKLDQYHAATGKPMPRLLVVIDEFQKLFEGDEDQISRVASLLEDIARRGRGFGIHLILASQAVTGIRGLAVKQDAIFGQIHNRISLINTATESQAFLSTHNRAAADLNLPGELILNESLGNIGDNDSGNIKGTAAWAERNYLASLRAQLFAQGHGDPPEVFEASAFAKWKPQPAVSQTQFEVGIAVGLPLGIQAKPAGARLKATPNQGVAVVGASRNIAIPVLVRAVTTGAASLGRGAHVTLLDGDSAEGSVKPWISALVFRLEQSGSSVERIGRSGIAAKLNDLAKSHHSADLVVPIALDSVDLGTPHEPDYILPNESLRTLLKNGPISQTWTIGWWQSKSVLDDHLGYRAPGIRAWALCGVSRDDLTDICGHSVGMPTASPRFVWFDRTADGGGGSVATRLVPYEHTDLLGEVTLD